MVIEKRISVARGFESTALEETISLYNVFKIWKPEIIFHSEMKCVYERLKAIDKISRYPGCLARACRDVIYCNICIILSSSPNKISVLTGGFGLPCFISMTVKEQNHRKKCFILLKKFEKKTRLEAGSKMIVESRAPCYIQDIVEYK